MPRPSKYSQQVADKILAALRAGNTRTASALYVGVDYSTLKRWAASNALFRAALDRAEAEAEVRYAATLAKAAQEGDWRAALAWLERRRHDDWRERKEIQQSGDVTINVKYADLGLDTAAATSDPATAFT